MKYRIVSKLKIGYCNELEEEFYIQKKVKFLFWSCWEYEKYPHGQRIYEDSLDSIKRKLKKLIKEKSLRKIVKKTPLKIYGEYDSESTEDMAALELKDE